MLSDYFPNLNRELFPIFEYVLGKDIADILIDKDLKISKSSLNKIYTLLSKYAKGVPIPYLTKTSHFYKDKFYITNDVLIPRPETEFLVENAIAYISNIQGESLNIYDVCTGSGCVGISIAKYVSLNHNIILTDISSKALGVCRINIQNLLKNTKNIQIVKSNLLEKVRYKNESKINVLISNPPYIPHSKIKKLDTTVKDYEPIIALDGGKQGYETTMNLLEQAKPLMADKFLILIEIDPSSKSELDKFSTRLFLNSKIEIIKDLYGIYRYLKITHF